MTGEGGNGLTVNYAEVYSLIWTFEAMLGWFVRKSQSTKMD